MTVHFDGPWYELVLGNPMRIVPKPADARPRAPVPIERPLRVTHVDPATGSLTIDGPEPPGYCRRCGKVHATVDLGEILGVASVLPCPEHAGPRYPIR